MSVYGFDRAIGIDKLNALVFRSQLQVTIADFVIEVEILRLEAAFVFRARVVSGPGTGQAYFGLDVQEERYIRTVWPADQIREFLNEIERDTAAVSLVRHRCMVVAVTDHHLIPLESRFDLFLNILASRRIEEQKFRCRRQVYGFGVQKDFTYSFSNCRSAGLAGNGVRNAPFLEIFG